jgi:hypothetical protein
MEKEVSRESILEPLFREIFEKESHHDHPIIMDGGRLRWAPNKRVVELATRISLNDLIPLFYELGHDKNSELYRKFYRDLGYSLNGYWEIFYWEANNPEAASYKKPSHEKIQSEI